MQKSAKPCNGAAVTWNKFLVILYVDIHCDKYIGYLGWSLLEDGSNSFWLDALEVTWYVY